MSTLLLSLISAYAMCAARRFAENLSGRVPSWEVSAELKDWKEAESQLHHAYALYVSQGTSPNEYLSRPDDHGARETAIRKVVHASFCARLNGKLDEVPDLRALKMSLAVEFYTAVQRAAEPTPETIGEALYKKLTD